MAVRLMLGVSLCACAILAGQFPLEGRVEGAGAEPMDRFQIVAQSAVTHERHTTWLRPDGSFSFNGIPEGVYELSVLAANGDVVARDTATLPGSGWLRLRLPERQTAGGAISLYRLSHEIPAAARRAFDKAAKASMKSNHGEAIEWLDKAIELDPEFAGALHRRGRYALVSRDFTAAARLLSRAADLDPSSVEILTDAALAEYAIESFEACERRAAAALRLDPSGPKPNYLRALALLRLGKPPVLAAPHLEKAAAEFPNAAEILSRIRAAIDAAPVMK